MGVLIECLLEVLAIIEIGLMVRHGCNHLYPGWLPFGLCLDRGEAGVTETDYVTNPAYEGIPAATSYDFRSFGPPNIC